LYPAPSANNQFGDATYQLVRHGIAHTFLLKGRIGVLRKQPTLHYPRDAQGVLLIDAVQLGLDFVDSYESRFKPLSAQPPQHATMESRLNEMEAAYQRQAATHGLVLGNAPLLSTVTSFTASATIGISAASVVKR
jgi:hypothetical protein